MNLGFNPRNAMLKTRGFLFLITHRHFRHSEPQIHYTRHHREICAPHEQAGAAIRRYMQYGNVPHRLRERRGSDHRTPYTSSKGW